MKKTLFVLLAMLLILAIMPATGLAASTIYVGPTDDLNAAISGAVDGDTIFIYDGTYSLDHVVLDKNLTITGESEDGVVLTPDFTIPTFAPNETDFYRATVASNSAWLFVDVGYTLNLSNVTMDGENNEIAFAVRSDGDLNVSDVTIKNTFRTDFCGFGIGIFPLGKLVATDVTMSNIERSGIYAASDADIVGFDYTGKGDSPRLDYGLNISPPRDGSAVRYVVNMSNSTIRNCGVSSSDWGSSALYLNSYYYAKNGGTDTQIVTLNVDFVNIYDCEVGLYVGYSDSYNDFGHANIDNTNFFGCGKDMDVRSLNNTPVSTFGNYYGGGAPNVYLGDGDVINGIDTFVTTPVPMNQDTEVTAGIDPSYMIIIPAAVDFGTLIKDTGIETQVFPVQAVDVVLEPGHEIAVGVTSDFLMNDLNGAGTVTLAYTLYNSTPTLITSGSEFAAFGADGTETGTVEVDTTAITAAGSYQGTMDFTISYQAE